MRWQKTKARNQSLELEATSQLIKMSLGEVAMPEDGTYYDRLHDKIMSAVFDEVDTSWMPIFAGTLFHPVGAALKTKKF